MSASYVYEIVAFHCQQAVEKCINESDVDVLVEFVVPAVSLLTLASLKHRLENELNKNVDVIHGPLDKDSMITLGKVVPVYEQ